MPAGLTWRLRTDSAATSVLRQGPLLFLACNSRYLEAMGMLNIYFGYAAEPGTAIAPHWLIPAACRFANYP
jgi:hypothetical protein